MAKSFLTAINLNKNELQNAVVQNLASPPGSPVPGQLYFDSTGGDQTLYWYDGSGWVAAKAPSTSGITQGEGDARYVLLSGSTPMTGLLTLSGAPTNPTHASTKQYVDDHITDATAAHAASAISYAGSTNLAATDVEAALDELDAEKQPLDTDLTTIAGLTATTGNMILSVSSAWASQTPTQVKTALALDQVTNTTDANKPVSTAQATADGLRLLKAGDAMTAGDLTLFRDPSSPLHASTKQYVDNLSQGLAWKDAVRAGTTVNITLSGLQTIDGVSVLGAERVLVKNQTNVQDNGIYLASAGAWARDADADAAGDVLNLAVFVSEGTTQADTAWVGTANAPITVGTTPLPFVQFGAGTVYVAGTGLALSTNTFNVGAGSGITVGADDVGITTAGVTNTHLATMAANTIKMNNTAGTASPTDVTVAAAKTALGVPSALPVPVSDGGTGRNTATTAYGLIAAGTTATGIQQTVTPAASGFLKTTNASALPAWTAIANTDVSGLGTLSTLSAVGAAQITDGSVTNAELANMAANSIKGNNTGSSAVALDLTVAQVKTLLAIANTDVSGLGTLSTKSTVATADITNDAVDNTKLANMAANSIKGNNTGSPADPLDLTVAQMKTLLGFPGKFTQATVGGATSQVITHNLNTQAVCVDVYRTLTPWDTVECDVERTSVNTCTLRFAVAPATNEYSVVVIG